MITTSRLSIVCVTAAITFATGNVFGHTAEEPPVHGYLTKEATMVSIDLLPEIFDYTMSPIDTPLGAPCGADYDESDGDDIVIGSGEEDNEKNPTCPSYEETPALLYWGERCESNEGYNGFFEHFFDPDVTWATGGINCRAEDAQYNKGLIVSLPAINDPLNGHYDSAYRLFEDLWVFKVLPLYHSGRIAEAYYWLGRAIHLIQDMTVPAHVHLLPHDDVFSREDTYENYHTMSTLEAFQGINYAGQSYHPDSLPNLPNDFDWSIVYSDKGGIVPDIFKMFWYAAQKTQYWGVATALSSNQAFGNDTYTTQDGETVEFIPSLWWGEDVQPIADPKQVAKFPDREAEALIPHAMRAVAGIFEVFEENLARYPASEWSKTLAKGKWNYVNHNLNSVVSLHASYVIYNGLQYSVLEAIDRGYLYNKVYAWYGTWYTNKADLDEWKVLPGTYYAIYPKVDLELVLVAIEGFPHTTSWFKMPQVWLR